MMKKTLLFLVVVALLALVGCGDKTSTSTMVDEDVQEAQPTQEVIEEVDEDFFDIENIDVELDLSDLDSLDEELNFE